MDDVSRGSPLLGNPKCWLVMVDEAPQVRDIHGESNEIRPAMSQGSYRKVWGALET